MGELIVNYSIFFACIFIFVAVVTVISRSKILSTIFKFLFRILSVVLYCCLLALFTIAVSMLAGMIILIHPFVFGGPHFFANGEPVHLLSGQEQEILIFALSYGILYVFLSFFVGNLFLRGKVRKFFNRLATGMLIIYRLNRNRHPYKLEEKMNATARHLLASFLVLILYPIVIPLLFPQLELTMVGNLCLFVFLIIFSTVPEPRYRQYNRRAA